MTLGTAVFDNPLILSIQIDALQILSECEDRPGWPGLGALNRSKILLLDFSWNGFNCMNWWQTIYQSLKKRIGNRVTEREIRLWLDAHGFDGSSAKLVEVTLYAIARPGWKQVFRFSGQVRDSKDKSVPIFGVLEGDQRYGDSKITLFHNLKDQTLRLKEASEGMIVRKH